LSAPRPRSLSKTLPRRSDKVSNMEPILQNAKKAGGRNLANQLLSKDCFMNGGA
jgi:hypothetical protein